MTEKLFEMAWPPGSSSIVPVSLDRVRTKADGSIVAHVTRDEMETIVALMKGMGLKDMNVKDAGLLSVRTTTWLVRLESGGDTLLVKPQACTVENVLNELRHSPELTGQKYFVYPVVVGRFQVQVAIDGFMIPTDRRLVNQDGQIVVDPDVQVSQVAQPLAPSVKESF